MAGGIGPVLSVHTSRQPCQYAVLEGKWGNVSREPGALHGSPSPRTPHLLLWIHTKITIAYPSRIFKSTIFHAPSRFSCLLSKKGKALLEEALQIQQGRSALLPRGPPRRGKALPPSSGGTTLADCRVTFPPAGGGFLCGFPRSTRPASGTAPARQRPGTAGFSPHQSASRPARCQRPAPPPTGASATQDRPQQRSGSPAAHSSTPGDAHG